VPWLRRPTAWPESSRCRRPRRRAGGASRCPREPLAWRSCTGAPAVAFAIAASAPGHYREARLALRSLIADITRARLHAAHARIDAAARPPLEEYDLVRGLTGLGASLLYSDPDPGLLAQVLRYLVRLTTPVPATDAAGLAVPGWWSSSNPNLTTSTPGGHGNFGMAHGISVIFRVKSSMRWRVAA
jgi:lantibiotic biosynthesis protein